MDKHFFSTFVFNMQESLLATNKYWITVQNFAKYCWILLVQQTLLWKIPKKNIFLIIIFVDNWFKF